MARRDSSVPLSRTRIPLIVVQDRLCSVHAAEAFCGGGPRLCVVNVKLTIGLAIGAALLGYAHSIPRRFSPGAGAGVTQGEVKQFGRRAGRGGDVTRDLRAKISTDKGGLSQSPPFFFVRARADPCPRTRCNAFALLRTAATHERNGVGPGSAAQAPTRCIPGYEEMTRTDFRNSVHSSARASPDFSSRSVRSSWPPATQDVFSRTGFKDGVERFKIVSCNVLRAS
jgi:hypothetical protein